MLWLSSNKLATYPCISVMPVCVAAGPCIFCLWFPQFWPLGLIVCDCDVCGHVGLNWGVIPRCLVFCVAVWANCVRPCGPWLGCDTHVFCVAVWANCFRPCGPWLGCDTHVFCVAMWAWLFRAVWAYVGAVTPNWKRWGLGSPNCICRGAGLPIYKRSATLVSSTRLSGR